MYSAISEYDSSYCSTYTNHAKERKPYDQFSGWSALRNIDEGHVVDQRSSTFGLIWEYVCLDHYPYHGRRR